VSLNVEVMWLLRGLKPDFRTSATAKLALVRSIPPRSYLTRHPRERGDPELGADRRFDSTRAVLRGVALGCPRTQRVRGQNKVGICFRGYSGPQTVVYSG
jgi:hypothetical protein